MDLAQPESPRPVLSQIWSNLKPAKVTRAGLLQRLFWGLWRMYTASRGLRMASGGHLQFLAKNQKCHCSSGGIFVWVQQSSSRKHIQNKQSVKNKRSDWMGQWNNKVLMRAGKPAVWKPCKPSGDWSSRMKTSLLENALFSCVLVGDMTHLMITADIGWVYKYSRPKLCKAFRVQS